MNIIAIPFNPERVRNDGASSLEEFREWVTKYGDNFLYTLGNLQTGDILIFAWIQKPGEWLFAGDAIVKQKHEVGKETWCNCTKQDRKGYGWHIITGGVRIYPKSVSSDDIQPMKLGHFAQISPETYQKIILSSVSHWLSTL